MTKNSPFGTILVPVDFSPSSLAAIEWALKLVGGDDPEVMLVHVIETALVNTLVEHGFGKRDEMLRRLRTDAEQKLEELQEGLKRIAQD